MAIRELPIPCLSRQSFDSVIALTDERLFAENGIRIAFTERSGGVSLGAYDSLNLADHVDDDLSAVNQNRAILTNALGAQGFPCVCPRQVHGDSIAVLSREEANSLEAFQARIQNGCDALVIREAGYGALLCFADCVPVIAVSPSGHFAVIHAGWRGVENNITLKALDLLAQTDREADAFLGFGGYNIYIGPHIRSECFEAGSDVRERFAQEFGQDCLVDPSHIDLGRALRNALQQHGVSENRIVESEICTACDNEHHFSFRAQDGICGRQGAYAFRLGGTS